MIEKDAVKRVPGRRDERCLQVVTPIVIPAGTIMRQDAGKPGVFTCTVEGGEFVLKHPAGTALSDRYRQVVA